MGHRQFPGVLVSEATASAQRQSGAGPHCQPARRRKVFYLLDAFNIGGTEVQAVELATRLNPERYDVTLRASGPLLQRFEGSPVSVREFYPEGGFDSVHLIYQMFRPAMFLGRGRFQVARAILRLLGDPGWAAALGRNGRARVSAEFNLQRRIEKTDQMYTERLHSRGAE